MTATGPTRRLRWLGGASELGPVSQPAAVFGAPSAAERTGRRLAATSCCSSSRAAQIVLDLGASSSRALRCGCLTGLVVTGDLFAEVLSREAKSLSVLAPRSAALC